MGKHYVPWTEKLMGEYKSLLKNIQCHDFRKLPKDAQHTILCALEHAIFYIEEAKTRAATKKEWAKDEHVQYHVLTRHMPEQQKYYIANQMAHGARLWGAREIILTRKDDAAEGRSLAVYADKEGEAHQFTKRLKFIPNGIDLTDPRKRGRT